MRVVFLVYVLVIAGAIAVSFLVGATHN